MIEFTPELTRQIQKLIDAGERVETVEFGGVRVVQEYDSVRVEFLIHGEPMAFLRGPRLGVGESMTISGINVKASVVRLYDSGRD